MTTHNLISHKHCKNLELFPNLVAHDVKGGRYGLRAGELHRSAVVDGVGRHQIGQQAMMASPNLGTCLDGESKGGTRKTSMKREPGGDK